jgi:hypothetical protein
MRATKSNICCEAFFPRYRRRKRVPSRRQFRMRTLAGRRSKDKAAPWIARSGPADVLAPPAGRTGRLQAAVVQQIAELFSQQVGCCLRRRGSSLRAASGGRAGMVSLRTRPWRSTSCLLSRARCGPRATRRSPGSMRSAASGSVDALNRVSKSAAFPRQGVPQGLRGVFHNPAVCGDNLVATGTRMRRSMWYDIEPLAARIR